jgi:hypothetical protein
MGKLQPFAEALGRLDLAEGPSTAAATAVTHHSFRLLPIPEAEPGEVEDIHFHPLEPRSFRNHTVSTARVA